MIDECVMIWLSLVENYASVVVSLVRQLEHKWIALADDVFRCSVAITVSLTDLHTVFPLFGTCHIVRLWFATYVGFIFAHSSDLPNSKPFSSSFPFQCSSHWMCADCHLPGTLCMWTDCTTCFESCASAATECGCLGGAGEAGLPLLFIMALIVLGLFTVIGIFYSVLVATMVGQRIWQRHYHILAKRMLTKEYVVEDVDGEMNGSDWSPPPLPPEHIQQLKTLGLL
ncbi:hypothetical protein Goklo_023913 [Gossypium klotzschianum]|uniref:Uncharacterized protein n=7 Tax=Gossypium TaxID=3633 RepID=A0A7J8W550_9ROSI|nr:hypothetical protein [Gossypium klotzschianum]